MQQLFFILLSIIWFSCDYKQIPKELTTPTTSVMDNLNKEELMVELTILNEDSIEIKVTNISDKMIRLYSHVESEYRHYDYFEVEAVTLDGEHLYFSFVGNRDKSAPIIVELEPNSSFSHQINLLAWANSAYNQQELESNGFQYLSGFESFRMRAKYLNSPCEKCNDYYQSIWSGYCFSKWETEKK